MQNINLNLSLDQVNLILNALGTQPYVQVAELIAKIQQQASGQLKQES